MNSDVIAPGQEKVLCAKHTYAKPIPEPIDSSLTTDRRYLPVSGRSGLQCRFALALSMYETAQPVLEEHINLSRRDHLCYFSNAEGLMRHGLPCTVGAGSVIGDGALLDCRGDVLALSLNVLTVPHLGQLTREIWPRLVTAVTMCPRSSSHFAHNLSARSPIANICFSKEFSSFYYLYCSKPLLVAADLSPV